MLNTAPCTYWHSIHANSLLQSGAGTQTLPQSWGLSNLSGRPRLLSSHSLPGSLDILHTICSGLNCDSQKREVEVPPPALQNVTLFGDRAFREINKLKMKSLGLALIQSYWCPYEKAKFGHTWWCKETWENDMWRRRIGMMHLQTREWKRFLANHQKLGRSEDRFPNSFQRERGIADSLIMDFQLPRAVRE